MENFGAIILRYILYASMFLLCIDQILIENVPAAFKVANIQSYWKRPNIFDKRKEKKRKTLQSCIIFWRERKEKPVYKGKVKERPGRRGLGEEKGECVDCRMQQGNISWPRDSNGSRFCLLSSNCYSAPFLHFNLTHSPSVHLTRLLCWMASRYFHTFYLVILVGRSSN